MPKSAIETAKTATRVGRVTVNLSPLAADALEHATEVAGGTKTDTINKALQMFDMIMSAQAAGGGAWIQDNENEEPVKARFY